MDEHKQAQLRRLPGVDRVLEYGTSDGHFDNIPKSVLIPAIRRTIENLREKVLASDQALDAVWFSRRTLVEDVHQVHEVLRRSVIVNN